MSSPARFLTSASSPDAVPAAGAVDDRVGPHSDDPASPFLSELLPDANVCESCGRLLDDDMGEKGPERELVFWWRWMWCCW